MKIWHGYGSEHSMNLVMIGLFKEARDAASAKHVIDQLTAQVQVEIDAGRIKYDEPTTRYSDEVRDLLYNLSMYNLGADELKQFSYDISTNLNGDQVVLTTDEPDVSAFLKVLIGKGARVEVYSAHDYPGEGHGRGG